MTFEWWEGACDDETVLETYRGYLDSVLDGLPPDLRRLATQFTLHDSEVLDIVVNPQEATATFDLDGFDPQDHRCRYSLHYSGLQQLRLITAGAEPLLGPAGLGHLGYDDLDLISPALVEHRLLFSTGAELIMRFSGFKLSARADK